MFPQNMKGVHMSRTHHVNMVSSQDVHVTVLRNVPWDTFY